MNMSSYNCCAPRTTESSRIKYLSELMKLVGEKNRLKILCLLRDNEHCVCEILEHLELSQSLVSHHLSDLKEAGLVEDEGKGRRVYYKLTEKGREAINTILSL